MASILVLFSLVSFQTPFPTSLLFSFSMLSEGCNPKLLSIYTLSQQLHCSDSLLISYSSYMSRRMYDVIRQPLLVISVHFDFDAFRHPLFSFAHFVESNGCVLL
jgi:hypothetical protein